jgi:hypothetical protein
MLCDLGDIGDGDTVIVTIDATVDADADASGSLSNSAVVASPDESNPTDNGSNTTGDIEEEPPTTTTTTSTTSTTEPPTTSTTAPSAPARPRWPRRRPQPAPPTTHELPSEPAHENPPSPPGPKHVDRGPLAFTGFDSGGVAIFGLVLLASRCRADRGRPPAPGARPRNANALRASGSPVAAGASTKAGERVPASAAASVGVAVGAWLPTDEARSAGPRPPQRWSGPRHVRTALGRQPGHLPTGPKTCADRGGGCGRVAG